MAMQATHTEERPRRRRRRVRRTSDRENLEMATLGKLIASRQSKPLILVDKNRSKLFTNVAAQRLLSRDLPIRVVNNQIEFTDAALNARFGHVLAHWPAKGLRTKLVVDETQSVEVVRLPIDELRTSRFALLLAQREARSFDPRYLIGVLGLTRIQAAIATAIYEGKTLREIALSQEIKLGKVREQVKGIFKCLNVNSQRKVVRIVSEILINAWD